MDEAGCGHLRLFAKIENREGMEKLPELIEVCDEIVIARGDLGNAMPLWELPAAQKIIAARCRAAGRDFMVVTQMLASMEHSPVPTRAEVGDIFNAVLDGAASVMVTGETAVGEYPVETIRYLVKAAREAERYRS
jgi:pyruvate kinase